MRNVVKRNGIYLINHERRDRLLSGSGELPKGPELEKIRLKITGGYMKNTITHSIVCLIFIMTSNNSLLSSQKWWNMPYPETFDADKLDKKLSFIHVEGNKFVDEKGNHILFRGVNISDPDKIQKNGHWNKRHFEVIKE